MKSTPSSGRPSNVGSAPSTTPNSSNSSTNQKTLESFVKDWHTFTSGCSPEFVETLRSVVHRGNIPNVHQGSDEERALAQNQINKIALHCIAKEKSELLREILKLGAVTRLALTDSPKIFGKPVAIDTLKAVLRGNQILTELDLGGNDLGEIGLDKLEPILETLKLTSLSLRKNKIEGPRRMFELFYLTQKIIHTLIKLDLSCNYLLHHEDMRLKTKGLKAPTLQELEAISRMSSKSVFGAGTMEHLVPVVNDRAKKDKVDISGCLSGVLLAKLVYASEIISIDVSSCKIDATFLVALAPGLKRINSLNLANNNLQGPEGAYAIKEIVKRNPKLMSLNIENNMARPGTSKGTLTDLMFELYQSETLTEFTYTHPDRKEGVTRTRKQLVNGFVAQGGEAITELMYAAKQSFSLEMGHEIARTIVEEKGRGRNQQEEWVEIGPVAGLETLDNLVQAAEIQRKEEDAKEKGATQ